MSPDTKLIVDAIDSLRQSSSFIKSYIMPFTPAVITSVIGFFIASHNFKSQETMRSNVAKIEAANKFMVQVESAFQTLISIKIPLVERVNDDPTSRLFSVGDINSYFSDIDGVENLVFLAKGNTIREGQPYYATWNNIPRINSMVGNYKYLLERIEARQVSKQEFEEYIVTGEDGNLRINFEALNSVKDKPLKKFINDNEAVLSLIDGLILEFNSFLSGISEAVNKSINAKKVEHIAQVIHFNNSNAFIQRALQPLIPPDYQKLARVFQIDVSAARELFQTGYF